MTSKVVLRIVGNTFVFCLEACSNSDEFLLCHCLCCDLVRSSTREDEETSSGENKHVEELSGYRIRHVDQLDPCHDDVEFWQCVRDERIFKHSEVGLKKFSDTYI